MILRFQSGFIWLCWAACFLNLCVAHAGPVLPQEAYVWQRSWQPSVCDAVTTDGPRFAGLVALAGEVTWHQKQPQVVRVPVNYAVLKKTGGTTGLALRIGPYAGPFLPNDPAAAFLARLALTILTDAKTNGLNPAELQLDFDCAESKLDGYRAWVEAIRRQIAPVPLTITTLPSWLNQPAFAKLVAATDGYVLQVHSLAAPSSAKAAFTLCDPAAAQRAVERAGQLPVPFRVALPTYGYVIAFDRQDRFVGLSAEGPARNWPAGAQTREVRTDPDAMARLVRIWTAGHPAALQGIIWYRLPVADDALNLRWPTLAAMMAGRSPRVSFHAAARRVEPGLVEISLVNDGELDLSSRIAIEAHWQEARLVAGDGLRGFDLADDGSSAVQFQSKISFRLPAGETRVIGWLRLSNDREVRVETKTF